MSDRVFIFDTTLRDGEQSCGCSMTVPEKMRMARKLVELNVDAMEAGFPMASDGDFEAVDRIGQEFGGVTVAALARCHTGDIERAAKALAKAKRPRIHTFIATSPLHLSHKLKMTEEKALEIAIKSVQLARRYVDEVEFSAEDATRTSAASLITFSKAVVDGGARNGKIPEICLTPSAIPSRPSTGNWSAKS
jgi:2-isopropylmalate synthase